MNGSSVLVATSVTLRAAGSVLGSWSLKCCGSLCAGHGAFQDVLWAWKFRHLQFISVVLRAGLGQWLPKAPLFAQNGHVKYKFIELQNW